MAHPFQAKINKAAAIMHASKHTVVFTGAGISTPSGIPDFRSPHSGLWNTYDPFEVASLTAFRDHPEKFYNWIKPLVETAQTALPNQAHICLAELENAGWINGVITQNIDGLHQKAGSNKVIELHGSAQSATCLTCGKKIKQDWLPDSFLSTRDLPRCNACSGILKPDVVLYEEVLPARTWDAAHLLCQKTDLIFVIGSSLEVFPANSLPKTALDRGAKLIINTLTETHLDKYADVVIQADLMDTIPPICKLILQS